jgi:hypothetical protein
VIVLQSVNIKTTITEILATSIIFTFLISRILRTLKLLNWTVWCF